MADITVEVRGAQETSNRLSAAAKSVQKQQLVAMREATLVIERHLKQRLLTGAPGASPLFGRTGAAPPTLGSVSGHLRRSVTSTAFTAVADGVPVVIGTVGTPVKYARIHEYGGTIQGKPLLRIPTRFAKTGAGVDRLAGVSARTDPTLVLVRSKRGQLWLARKPTPTRQEGAPAAGEQRRARRRWTGKPGGIRPFWPGLVPMYLLVPSVRIPKRAPFAAALRETTQDVQRILGGVARDVTLTASGGGGG